MQELKSQIPDRDHILVSMLLFYPLRQTRRTRASLKERREQTALPTNSEFQQLRSGQISYSSFQNEYHDTFETDLHDNSGHLFRDDAPKQPGQQILLGAENNRV